MNLTPEQKETLEIIQADLALPFGTTKVRADIMNQLVELKYVKISDFKGKKFWYINDVRQIFIDLIGEPAIKFIENKNWVIFYRKPFDIYKTNEIEIQFLKTDNKGDDVIFFSICYNEDNQKWFSENCIDEPEILFDTYDEMKNHVKTIERDIIDNGFGLAKLY